MYLHSSLPDKFNILEYVKVLQYILNAHVGHMVYNIMTKLINLSSRCIYGVHSGLYYYVLQQPTSTSTILLHVVHVQYILCVASCMLALYMYVIHIKLHVCPHMHAQISVQCHALYYYAT